MGGWNIDRRFDTAANASVLAFLRRTMPSAHTDVADELIRSARGLAGVRSWCPDPARYAFVVLHVADGTIFGLAYGQSSLGFRLSEERGGEAAADGGRAADEIGPGWVRFEPWTGHETLETSRRRLARWCSLAAELSTASPSASRRRRGRRR